jgi:hypothetical protein
MMIMTKGAFRFNLSVQQILSCLQMDGCEGGSPEDLCMRLASTGKRLKLEQTFPYKQAQGGEVSTPCSNKKGKYEIQIKSDSVKSLATFIPETGYDVTILQDNINNMKLTLFTEGPFYCAMTVYEDFFQYNGLTPYRPGKNAKKIGGHAIEIVGFCDKGADPRTEYNKIGYWICRNSWGTTKWPRSGDRNGFFTIVMGENICGIESRCGRADPLLWGPNLPETKRSLDDIRLIRF